MLTPAHGNPAPQHRTFTPHPTELAFTQTWGAYEAKVYLLHDFEVYFESDSPLYFESGLPLYFGLFQPKVGNHATWVIADWTDFQRQWSLNSPYGLRMHDFEAFYTSDGALWYLSIWHEGTDNHDSFFTSNWTAQVAKWHEWGKPPRHLQMHDFETFLDVSGTRIYTGIFREGTDGQAVWFTHSWNDFFKKRDEFDRNNLQLWDFEFWQEGPTWTYDGVFRKDSTSSTSSTYMTLFNHDWESFAAFNHARKKEGCILHDIEIFPSTCSIVCMNNVIVPGTQIFEAPITGTPSHCEGFPPATCSGNIAGVALFDIPPIFTFPFSDTSGMTHNGWLYSPGYWHQGIDYVKIATTPAKHSKSSKYELPHLGQFYTSAGICGQAPPS
ncbi:hypothetical protein B0H63DRAFT_523646 [Podospora didyma]|uniref:Uncharacterized protein n=1 Tax=Podospora didyma TaxID=330526 RepID=A0AAE0NGA9_9PEZI|nr:hypothetical protein B0H63DRAFT_523646 [Podospora didyma]